MNTCDYSYVTSSCGKTNTTKSYRIRQGKVQVYHRCKNHQHPAYNFDTEEAAWAALISRTLSED